MQNHMAENDLSYEQLSHSQEYCLGLCNPKVEMFLDRTDLSKTVDRHGMECCHVLSRSSRFLVAVLFERQPVLLEYRGPVLMQKWLKTVKTGLDKPRTGRSSLSELFEFHVILYRNQFFPCFHIISPLFLACLQSFKGLSKTCLKVCRTSFKALCRGRSRPFWYFSHQKFTY